MYESKNDDENNDKLYRIYMNFGNYSSYIYVNYYFFYENEKISVGIGNSF